ncbi:hypothetical protein SAMN04487819_1013 [Actinopolyspora alba]|uniref:Uncharacterized protein n=1 Tax=Actinopolyspora alba TaxID=673379 RepID=A0A1I1TKG2_9ACTN|nr:hypothetical protein [Actinopolyspora alba]SFD55920.1 hypothetical protein SAMN04487819_1013 [Actinopolyspora alba]
MYSLRFCGAAVSSMGIASTSGNPGVLYGVLSILSLLALLLAVRSVRLHRRPEATLLIGHEK